MNKIRSGFSDSWKVIKGDKIIMLLALVPIGIGAGLYGILGSWLFTSILPQGKLWIDGFLAQGTWGTIAYYAMVTLLTILMIFVVNWTFFLVVSLLSSPFNDLISARAEKRLVGGNPEDGGGIRDLFRRLGKTLLNEFKKIAVIFLLSLMSLGLNYTGILAPVGVAISALLLSVSFLDYSWNRHDMAFGACFRQVRQGTFTYLFSGLIFLFLLSVPILNLFMMPLAAVYFTVLFTHQKARAKA